MERYMAFPGSSDGLRAIAKDVDLSIIGLFGDPSTMTVMRKHPSGNWVQCADALQRSRKEFDKGLVEGKRIGKSASEGMKCSTCYDAGVEYGKRIAKDENRELVLTAYNDGLAVGRKQGQVKLDAYIQSSAYMSQPAVTPVEPAGLWSRPGTLRGSATDVSVPLSDTRTNQLLNELYHDRARLERVVHESVNLLQLAHEIILAKQDGTEADVDEDYVLGQMVGFVDTQGE